MHVYLSNRQRDVKFSLDKKKIEEVCALLISSEGQRCDEVSISFVSSKKLTELHKQYFNDPTPTDCISFPIDEEGVEPRLLGEIYISPKTAKEYAGEHGCSAKEELLLYLVHGLLHLLGYDDLTEEERSLMRKKEHHYMRLLKEKQLLDITQDGNFE